MYILVMSIRSDEKVQSIGVLSKTRKPKGPGDYSKS